MAISQHGANERIVGGRRQTLDPGSRMWFDAGPVTPIIDEDIPVPAPLPTDIGLDPQGMKLVPQRSGQEIQQDIDRILGGPSPGNLTGFLGTLSLQEEGALADFVGQPVVSVGEFWDRSSPVNVPTGGIESAGTGAHKVWFDPASTALTREERLAEAGAKSAPQIWEPSPSAASTMSPAGAGMTTAPTGQTLVQPAGPQQRQTEYPAGYQGDALKLIETKTADLSTKLANSANAARTPASSNFYAELMSAVSDPPLPFPAMPAMEYLTDTTGKPLEDDGVKIYSPQSENQRQLYMQAVALRQQTAMQNASLESAALDRELNRTGMDIQADLEQRRIWLDEEKMWDNREIAMAEIAADKEIARQSNISEKDIAILRNQAEKDIATTYKWAQIDVARTQKEAALGVAQSEKAWQEYQAAVTERIARDTNISAETIARINNAAAVDAAWHEQSTAKIISGWNNASAENIARMSGESQETIAEYQANAQGEVARLYGISAREVAEIQAGSASQIAQFKQLTDVQVSNIRAEVDRHVANQAGITAIQVAQANTEALTTVAQKDYDAAVYEANNRKEIAEDQFTNNLAIANATFNDLEVVETIRKQAQIDVATANNATAKDIAEIEAGIGAARNMSDADIVRIQTEVQERMATSLNVTQFDIANMQANAQVAAAAASVTGGLNFQQQQTIAGLEARGGLTAEERLDEIAAQTGVSRDVVALQTTADAAIAEAANTTSEAIAGIRAAVERDVAAVAGLSSEAVATINAGVAEQAVETQTLSDQQIAQIQADVQREIATQTGLNQLQIAQIQADAQVAAARGGLTPEQRMAETGLQARGGLTPEQRLAEMQAQQQMAGLQARGGLTPEQRLAEIQGVMGGATTEGVPSGLAQLFGGQGIPTMAQASQFTPAIANLLTGLAASQGIQPTTLGQLIQSVTPLGGGTASTFAV